jgi:hypothetical protein
MARIVQPNMWFLYIAYESLPFSFKLLNDVANLSSRPVVDYDNFVLLGRKLLLKQ